MLLANFHNHRQHTGEQTDIRAFNFLDTHISLYYLCTCLDSPYVSRCGKIRDLKSGLLISKKVCLCQAVQTILIYFFPCGLAFE